MSPEHASEELVSENNVPYESGNSGSNNYSCSMCKKVFSVQSEALVHEQSHYRKERLCPICNNKFFNSQTLLAHVRSHLGEKPFKCVICDRSFTRKYDMERHKRLHRQERKESPRNKVKYVKEVEGNIIKSGTDLLDITGNLFKCDNSEVTFPDCADLLAYAKEHVHVPPELVESEEIPTGSNNAALDKLHQSGSALPKGYHDVELYDSVSVTIPVVKSQSDENVPAEDPLSLNTKVGEPGNSNSNNYSCSVCKKTFPLQSVAIVHEQSHSTEPGECVMCCKIYANTHTLLAHVRSHLGEKPFKCVICDRSFTRKYDMQRHRQMHKEERKESSQRKDEYVEEDEDNSTHSDLPECADLLVHNVPPYTVKSEEHPTGGSQSSVLDKSQQQHTRDLAIPKGHRRKYKPPQDDVDGIPVRKIYKCDLCPKTYYSKNMLPVHRRTHTGDLPYQCEVCAATFSEFARLRDHSKRIHTNERPNKCDQCSMAYVQRAELRRHYRIHTGEKPKQCEICGNSFRTPNGLRNHQLWMHSGKRPHICQICKKCFVDKHHLKRHFRIHTGENPYVCEVCGKECNQKGNLRIHMKVHKK